MRIDHIAIWTKNIEKIKEFYVEYFNAKANEKYRNNSKNFESYFLSFDDGARIEIMQMPSIPDNLNDIYDQYLGLIHFAISVDDKSEVVNITEKLRKDGYEVVSEPRITGDGYFESVVLDPEGNRIEIVA